MKKTEEEKREKKIITAIEQLAIAVSNLNLGVAPFVGTILARHVGESVVAAIAALPAPAGAGARRVARGKRRTARSEKP